MEVVRVPFVYGGFYYVAAADLADARKTYLPLYTRTGKRWDETTRGMKRGVATTLHRENIGAAMSEES